MKKLLMILFAFSFSINLAFAKPSSEEVLKDNTQKSGLIIKNKKELEVCNDYSNNCFTKNAIFGEAYLDTKDQNIKEILANINKETENQYNHMLNSKIQNYANYCYNVIEKYNYRYLDSVSITSFKNDNYISIKVNRTVNDLCTKNIDRDDLEIYFYDVKAHKLLNNEEIKNSFSLNEEEFEEIVSDYAPTEELVQKYLSKKASSKVYINEFGNLEFAFYTDVQGFNNWEMISTNIDQKRFKSIVKNEKKPEAKEEKKEDKKKDKKGILTNLLSGVIIVLSILIIIILSTHLKNYKKEV